MARQKGEQHRRCPDCGVSLDPQERCDCKDGVKDVEDIAVVAHYYDKIANAIFMTLNTGATIPVYQSDYEDYIDLYLLAHPLYTRDGVKVNANDLVRFVIRRRV